MMFSLRSALCIQLTTCKYKTHATILDARAILSVKDGLGILANSHRRDLGSAFSVALPGILNTQPNRLEVESSK